MSDTPLSSDQIDLASLAGLIQASNRRHQDQIAEMRAEIRALQAVPRQMPGDPLIARAWRATKGWRTTAACVALAIAPYLADSMTRVNWDQISPTLAPIIAAIFFGLRAWTSTPIFKAEQPGGDQR